MAERCVEAALLGVALCLGLVSTELTGDYDTTYTRVQTSALTLGEWAGTITDRVEPVKTRKACMGMCKADEACSHFSWEGGACFLGDISKELLTVAGVADLGDVYIDSGL